MLYKQILSMVVGLVLMVGAGKPTRTPNRPNQDGIPLENFQMLNSQPNTALATDEITGGHLKTTAGDPAAQPPIVTLTEDQKRQVLSTYGSYFGARQQRSVITENESADISPETEPFIQLASRSNRFDICPPRNSYDLITLYAENVDGKMVQLVHIDDGSNEQWILNEECSNSYSYIVDNVKCGVRSRLVRAAVIDLEKGAIVNELIKVYSCYAYYVG